MIITKSIKIDLVDRVVLAPVHAVQCDANTRAVAVTLTAAGVAWEPPAGAAVSVAFRKPDGKKGWYDKLSDGSNACSVSGNVVTAILAPEVLTVAGQVDAVIVFQDGSLNQLATFGFTIAVEKNPAAGTVISNDYYNYTNMAEVNQAMEDFFAQAEAEQSAFMEKVETDQAAFLETAGEALAAVHEAATADAPAIVCEASGDLIAVPDASDRLVQGLRVFGKTTQDGTPSPDNPVELVSVGDSGSVGMIVAGKNFLDVPELLSFTKSVNAYRHIPKGTYILSCGSLTTEGTKTPAIGFYGVNGTCFANWTLQANGEKTITLKEDAFRCSVLSNGWDYSFSEGVSATIEQLMISADGGEYEPYKGQTLTFATPNGLPGIPVTSGGNYTDESGQQYIANYRDWDRGVDVQRVLHSIADTKLSAPTGFALYRAYFLDSPVVGGNNAPFLCSVTDFESQSNSLADTHYYIPGDGKTASVFVPSGYDVEANPIEIMGQLATPIETPIPEEELAAYRALHTNKPNTTVFNDAGAHMELSYVADSKTYIDNKFAELAAQIVNNT